MPISPVTAMAMGMAAGLATIGCASDGAAPAGSGSDAATAWDRSAPEASVGDASPGFSDAEGSEATQLGDARDAQPDGAPDASSDGSPSNDGPADVAAPSDAGIVRADVVIYGATAAGVMAAVAAAREGARVVLLEPGRHVGGMVSGG